MADADLSEGERTVLILNPHWKTVLWPFVLLVVVAVAAAVLLIVIPHNRLQGAERIAVGAVAHRDRRHLGRGADPALEDHHLRADHPAVPAALRRPVPDRP